ncbi:MAG: hypothetical protein IH819_05740, partial [Bacteroidetes bacterium]|nr:hypothetical protein [Bacteroidota bacterium]
MAGPTENISPIVTQAVPTDTTTEESSSEKTVQLAQAAATVEVASPGRGAEDSISVEAGLTYRLVDPVLRFTQDGGNLVVHWRDGGHTTLEDYLVFAQTDLPPALTLADGTVISFDQLVASIEGFDLGVIAPAAAPAAAQAAGGAFNTPFDGGDIGEGPGITDLLLGTELQFGLLELSRQRIDMELTRGLRTECGNCGGTGFVPTVNTAANNVLRKLRELAASGAYSEIRGELPLEYANFLLNKRRESLRDLELEFGLVLHLVGNPALPAGQPIQPNGLP